MGPGRGSGAGSLVAYCLKITDIDPIQFNLLFERFINPERISMPDFDVDFCQDRRGEVIEYVARKYGARQRLPDHHVRKAAGQGRASRTWRACWGFRSPTPISITKLLPDELGITLEDALEREPRLREKIEQDPRLAKVMEYALALEGLYRNAGMHAAGVIITEKPVVDVLPALRGQRRRRRHPVRQGLRRRRSAW